jgi:uncharacterized protein YggT (Ycf19 family)
MTAMLVLASTRTQVADFLQALIDVYSIIIIAYVLVSLFFGFGGRMAYSRGFDMVFTFLRDTVEPYLGLFRRFIPPLGPIDISPIIGLLVLQIVGQIIVNAIHG